MKLLAASLAVCFVLISLAGCAPSTSDDNTRLSLCPSMSVKGPMATASMAGAIKNVNLNDTAAVGEALKPVLARNRRFYAATVAVPRSETVCDLIYVSGSDGDYTVEEMTWDASAVDPKAAQWYTKAMTGLGGWTDGYRDPARTGQDRLMMSHTRSTTKDGKKVVVAGDLIVR